MGIKNNVVKVVDVENIQKEQSAEDQIPSTIQADTLFNFTKKLGWLCNSLKIKMLSPRYCEENIEYLNINGIKRIAFPMKCFCDINLHNIKDHLEWYGYYGLAFSKEWGMKQKIQPVHYVNKNSMLCKDFSTAFSTAFSKQIEDEAYRTLQDFILHEMMYYKPYQGLIYNENRKEEFKKCFTEESEWRFVPNVETLELQQAYFDEDIFNAGTLQHISSAMNGKQEVSLEFSYSDIKYIIIKSNNDFQELTSLIDKFELKITEKYNLISKIIVWNQSKRDF